VHTTLLKLALHGVLTRSIQFFVLILRHPHMVVREQCSLRLDTSRTRQQLLRRQWCELVTDRISRLRVSLGGIDNFEDAVVEGVSVDTGRLVDSGLANLVEVAVRIRFFVPRCGVGLLIGDSVLVAVDRRVKACVEYLVRQRLRE
jgi:hypothetical protein